MSLLFLNTPQLIPILSGWANEQREIFRKIEQLAPFLSQVIEIHGQLVAADSAARANAEMAVITDEMSTTDELHDLSIRGYYYLSKGVAMCLRALDPPREEAATNIDRTREQILPRGLSHVRDAYPQETGYAEQVRKMLDPELEAQLKFIPLPEGNALDVVNRWIELGLKLGDLERRRSVIKGTSSAAPTLKTIRSRAISLVSLIMDILEHCQASADQIAAIRQPVLDAVAAAKRRYEARTNHDETGSKPEPRPPGRRDDLPESPDPSRGDDLPESPDTSDGPGE